MALALAIPGASAPALAAGCETGRCGCSAATAAAVAPGTPTRDLTITYYGVSTLMFSDGKDRLLVDGFFSRPSAPRLVFLPIDSDPGKVDEGLGHGLPPVRAVLTAHAHHDHALDTAVVAQKQAGAIVVGTPSVAKLVQARHVPSDRVCVAVDGQEMTFGPYKVTAHYAPHGPAVFFLRWILDHPLKRNLSGPAWFGSYKDDKNLSYLVEYGGRRILVHPSAGASKTVVDAEVVFLGLGRVGKMSETDAQAYWEATVRAQTATVVPIHWDQFTTEVGKPLIDSTRLLDNVKAGRTRVCGYAKSRPELSLIWLDAKEQLTLSSGAPARRAAAAHLSCD